MEQEFKINPLDLDNFDKGKIDGYAHAKENTIVFGTHGGHTPIPQELMEHFGTKYFEGFHNGTVDFIAEETKKNA